MSITPTVGVTGVTGHVGGLVARALADAGVPQRLLVRSPWNAPDLPDAEATHLNEALEAGLTGYTYLDDTPPG